jgi:hypothetical protein
MATDDVVGSAVVVFVVVGEGDGQAMGGEGDDDDGASFAMLFGVGVVLAVVWWVKRQGWQRMTLWGQRSSSS